MSTNMRDKTLWLYIDTQSLKLQPTDIGNSIININTQIKDVDICCIQILNKYALVVCKDKKTKDLLTNKVITIANKSLKLQDFINIQVQRSYIRVSIHDVPLWVSDEELEQWLDSWTLGRHGTLDWATIGRKPGQWSATSNGYRFCYVQSISKPCPRFTTLEIPDELNSNKRSKFPIRVFYSAPEPQVQPINCAYCKEVDHTIEYCDARHPRNEALYHGSTTPDMIVFQGPGTPLSNFFPCNLKSVKYKQTFPSSEHYFQYAKLVELNAPISTKQQVLNAQTPVEAKKVADNFKRDLRDISLKDAWMGKRVSIMREALLLKYHSSPEFRTYLEGTKPKVLVEGTHNRFWASGLSRTDTIKAKKFPGSNKLGEMLMDLRNNPPVADPPAVSEGPSLYDFPPLPQTVSSPNHRVPAATSPGAASVAPQPPAVSGGRQHASAVPSPAATASVSASSSSYSSVSSSTASAYSTPSATKPRPALNVVKDLMDKGLGKSPMSSPDLMREADELIESLAPASDYFNQIQSSSKRKERSPNDKQPLEKRKVKSSNLSKVNNNVKMTNYYLPLEQLPC